MKPQTLHQAIQYFSSPENCMKWLVSKRWPDGVPVCPQCGRTDATFLPDSQKWQCKSAHKSRQFSAKVGTIFEDSHISLDKWLTALWMLCNCKNGISSYELAGTIGVTQKTAWFVLHRLRYAMQQGSLAKIGGGSAPVEVDETFIGGKARFMHKDRKLRVQQGGRNSGGKTVVMGMLERGGNVKTVVIPARREKALMHGAIRVNVESGTTLMTDEFVNYMGLSDYSREVINHLEGYVRGHIHTNGIENFWSLLKRGLSGTYVSVEPFHLFRYVDEQAFRFNTRKDGAHKITRAERFDMALSQINGKRLTFAEVTGKVGETSF
jgi:transposase-like protein